MARKQKFWEVFHKHDTLEFEVRGLSIDDTDMNKKVCEMQKAGFSVNCNAVPSEIPREKIIRDKEQQGYKHVDGLFYDVYYKCNKPEK